MVNVDKALIVGDFNIHVDNTNDALRLAFSDLINSFGVKENVTGTTHNFNHTLDFIISHGIDLTDTDIVSQSDDVTDHFLVSCMLHITDIEYKAPRYRPGRTIVPATEDRFTNNLPDFSQLLCISINTDELDKITSNMGTIFSNTLEIVAPIILKKIREKRAAPWFNSYPVMTGQRRVDPCAVRCLIDRIKQAKVSGQKQEYQRQGRDINNTRQKSGSQAQVQSSKVGQSGVKHRDNK